MNKEEILNKYIDLIDKGYCSDCNELNCIDNFPHSKIARAIRELQQENKQLKEKINTYENPEDLTLMFMYCDEKAKDKIKELKDNWNKLKEWLEEQKDNRKYANDVERFTAYGATLDKMQEIESGINE